MTDGTPFDTTHFLALSLDLCCVASLEGEFLYVNPRFREVLGYEDEELLNKPFLEYVHPEDHPKTLAEMEKLERGILTFHFKNRYFTKDGRLIWLSWNARALPEQGIVYAIAREVTQEEEANEITRLHRLWLKKAERMSGVGHWRLSLQNSDLYWSDEIFTIHGLNPETYTPELDTAIDAYHPDDREKVGQHVQNTIDTGAPFDFRCRIIRPDGTIRLVWSRGERLDGEDGTPIALFGVFMDLTEQSQLRNLLEESEQRYSSLYNRTPAMLHSIDHEGRLLEVSDFWLEKMGYTREQVLGRKSVDFLTEESKELAKTVVSKFLQTGQCKDVPYRFIKANGEEFDVLLSADSERDKQGNVVRSVAVSADVTQRLLAEKALRKSHAELLQKDQELREIAWAASHDLKAPLRNVQMFNSLALEICDDETRKHLEYVDRAGERLRTVIADFTAYLALEGVEVTQRPIDLNELLKYVTDGLESDIRESQAELSIPNLPTLPGVRKQLYSLFENVLSNSIKFCAQGRPFVKLQAEESEAHWHFIVEDNGIGVEEQFREDVFKLFRRLHTPDSFSGTGAGLTIAKKIVELHGGEIAFLPCESGARLSFSLRK